MKLPKFINKKPKQCATTSHSFPTLKFLFKLFQLQSASLQQKFKFFKLLSVSAPVPERDECWEGMTEEEVEEMIRATVAAQEEYTWEEYERDTNA